MKVGIIVISIGLLSLQTFIGWFVFLGLPSLSFPPLPSPPTSPACILDGGRPLHTLLLTFCISPDAEVTLEDGADTLTRKFVLPKATTPFHVVTGGLINAEDEAARGTLDWTFTPSEEVLQKPRVAISVCHGFHVVDARWSRADGLRARVIMTLGVWAEYGWVSEADASLFDEILNRRRCDGIHLLAG